MVNGIVSEEEGDAGLPPNSTNKRHVREDPRERQAADSRVHEREDANLDHMHSLADDIVAKLVEEDEPRVHQQQPPPPGNLSDNNSPPPEDQWFYTDPQVSF